MTASFFSSRVCPGFAPEPFHSSGSRAEVASLGGRVKSPTEPEGRGLLCPEPEDTVVGGQGLDAVPKHLPGGIGHGKIRIALVVQQAGGADDLEADCTENFAVPFNDLKLGESGFPIDPQADAWTARWPSARRGHQRSRGGYGCPAGSRKDLYRRNGPQGNCSR